MEQEKSLIRMEKQKLKRLQDIQKDKQAIIDFRVRKANENK